jgi:23S rRNA pseudouridine1911/1915/1917 synthase
VPLAEPAPAVALDIPAECAGQRVDQALARLFPQYSRSRLQRWLLDGHITVDGAPAAPKRVVWGGERIELVAQPDPEETAFAPEAIALDLRHEDDALLVVNKPAGLVVHPGSGNWSGTLLNALLAHAPQLRELPRAGIVHRLDKDTSGLLVVAKTLESQTSLVRQLQSRTVEREYVALVHGRVDRDGSVSAPIGRDPRVRTRMAVTRQGKVAVTHYRVRDRFPSCTLLECRLETGRTHQIRVHMSEIGHPLVGDPVYGRRRAAPDSLLASFPRQALHARRLALLHPVTGERAEWQAGLPSDMSALFEALSASSQA